MSRRFWALEQRVEGVVDSSGHIDRADVTEGATASMLPAKSREVRARQGHRDSRAPGPSRISRTRPVPDSPRVSP